MDNYRQNSFIDDENFYLYKHVDATDGSLCILSKGTLKFTQPQNFNDPFDCFFGIDANFYPSSSKVKDILKNKAKLSPSKRILDTQRIRNFFKHNKNNNPLLSHVHRKAYICCLNQNPLNILMWSHYAQFHKGFMIEFKLPFHKESLLHQYNFTAQPVEYVDHYPIVSKESFKNGQVQSIIFHKKSKDWAYEKEFRVVRYSDQLFSKIQPYPRNLILCSVVCGSNMEQKFKEKLIEIVEAVSLEIGRIIPVYQAEKIPNKYALTVPNHPRLDILANSKKK